MITATRAASAASASTVRQLRRSLGMIDATALVVGSVIGAGIFRVAAPIASHLHSPWLIMAVWVAGGLISFCGALCYAELGAAYPKTGGDYIYIQRAYGPLAGFLFGWTKIFTERIGTISILGFVFAEYFGSVLGLSTLQTKGFAAGAILLLTAANIVGIHVGKGIQNLLTAIKLGALLAIVAVGLWAGVGRPEWIGPPWPVPADGVPLHAFGVALVFVLWTYGGWTESSYVAEEIRNPRNALPWSILLGLAIVTALYLAVNWVYLIFIPLAEMPGRPLVAAEVMRTVVGPFGGTLTALMVAASALGALNGYILTSGRILLAVGRDHPLFSRAAAIHPRFATPARALAFNALAAIALLWLGTFDQIVTYSTVVISLFFALAALAVVVLRVKDPQRPRPYRLWGYPVTPFLFVLAMGLFVANMVRMQPKETLFGFGLCALGLPLYALSHRLRKKGAALSLVFFLLLICPARAGEAEFLQEREEMVREQILLREVRNPRVLEAMRRVPRHEFVPKSVQPMAYMDSPLPIGEGQTISQPYIVALMTDLAEVDPGEKVLEVGTGSGYQAAVLAEITSAVFTIEILPRLAARAQRTLARLGYSQVKVRVGDGYLGWPEEAPFDAIVVTAAPDQTPQPLVDQLAEGGVLVIPVGASAATQHLLRIRKKEGKVAQEQIIPVRFVPLIRAKDRL